MVAKSAGFESGKIGGLPVQVMQERGLHIKQEAPSTVFQYSRADTSFDYVITLCNTQMQENYELLYDITETLFKDEATVLHWNVRDFMRIEGESPKDKLEEARKIVDDLDIQIRKQFLNEIEPQKTG
jgi:protein-tyrosine-phosphatase